MHSSTIASVALFAASALAYPTPTGSSVADIAGGSTPNGTPPKNISAAAIADFQGVNFLENMESAFFEQGLKNLTAWNYNGELDAAIEVVTRVHAQELIHVQTAENILNHFHKPTFSPCQYQFPVTTAEEFLDLANIITSVGIGAVINVASSLALTDPGLVPGPASILSTEARHDAFFRIAALDLVPNPTPFDTRLSAAYALNLASPFIVPGSCAAMPKFPVIPPLTQVKPQGYQHGTTGTGVPIQFTVDADVSGALFIGWVNQANVVNYTPAKMVAARVVETVIPEGLGGMAFAALTNTQTATDVNALTGLTLAGPAPVQIS
ncbi:MAG: hypothetical protein Q9195_008920 [Heterodermia aff. obscurata]